MEIGRSELASKLLLTLFPYEKQEKAIKNKEPGPTSPETIRLAHKRVQLVPC